MRTFLIVLSLAVVGSTVPLPLWAGGEGATPAEERDYAQREAESIGLEQFHGGFHEVLITILIIAAIVIVVYWIVYPVTCHHYPGCGHGIEPAPRP